MQLWRSSILITTFAFFLLFSNCLKYTSCSEEREFQIPSIDQTQEETATATAAATTTATAATVTNTCPIMDDTTGGSCALATATATPISDPSTLNILIIGSDYDSGRVFVRSAKPTTNHPFPAKGIRTQLEEIINGGLLSNNHVNPNPNLHGIQSVNVVLEERPPHCHNLVSWFHWPDGQQQRWKNLRNEGTIRWDYIILIGDPYTLENQPGLYTHGVAKISQEIAKSRTPTTAAKVVLLLSWPDPSSSSTVDHYKEVVYRTGRSGGFKVAPAGLAWRALGSPTSIDVHSYIAAAAIYSRIWGSSTTNGNSGAAKSNFQERTLAPTIDAIVASNKGVVQYTGRFHHADAFCMLHLKELGCTCYKANGCSSTEGGFLDGTRQAVTRTGGRPMKGTHLFVGRDTGVPNGSKDYRNIAKNKNNGTRYSFGYAFHHVDGKDVNKTLRNIFQSDIVLAHKMAAQSDLYRIIPRRLLVASALQEFPGMPLMKDKAHVSEPTNTMVGSYIYTIMSGRCPVDARPDDRITRMWYSQKVGYETAWHVGTCQVRAPGFKVKPMTELFKQFPLDEDVTFQIEFLNPPTANVVVTVSLPVDTKNKDQSSTLLGSAALTFTTESYNVSQSIMVKAGPKGQHHHKRGTPVQVQFHTRSTDEVFNELEDSWEFKYFLNPK